MVKAAVQNKRAKKSQRKRWVDKLKALPDRYGLVVCYTLLTILLSITLSWVVLAKSDFLYGIWHDYGGIGAAIDKYGPSNRYKVGFGETTREERIRLFAAINRSVHRGGTGLEQIAYSAPALETPQLMLREPEVVHLQDVANLIDVLFWVGFGSFILWVEVTSYLLLVKKTMPGLKDQLLAMLSMLLACMMAVFLIGPNKVFSAFHIWVFPDGHQWFFYYQESLMSTLMYAPYLFAWIAFAMVLLAIVFFLVIQFILVYTAVIADRYGRRC